jgi:diguanylate cyclase (GGDEF)-like protein/PAS domain S-box-containing protein
LVVGALAGVTNLTRNNFLDNIARNHYGETGSFLVVARSLRQIIAASDKKRVLEAAPELGKIPLIDKFMTGFNGSGILVNPLGVEVLQSAKAVPLANWYAAVQMPIREAFAPIERMHENLLLATMLLTIVSGGLTWWMLRRQLQPMLDTASQLATLANSEHALLPLPVQRDDEIGHMLHGFNRLLSMLGKREEDLRASEQKFRTLIEWAPQPMVVHRGGKIIYANPAGLQLIGAKTADDIVGSPILRWVHPSCHAMVIERASRPLTDSVPIEPAEEIFVRVDGRSIDVEVQSTNIIFEGSPAVHVAIRDITERKHALRIAQQYEAVVRGSIDGFWITDASGNIVEANDAACVILGYSREELLRLKITDIEADESSQETADHTRNIMESGHLRFEARHKRKDGAIIYVDVSVVYVESLGARFFAFVRNITDRKRIELQLRQSANVFSNAREGIVLADLSGNIVDVNAAFTDITGYARDEVLGKNPRFMASGRHDAAFYSDMWTNILSQGFWSGEIWNRRKNGEIYPELLTISAVVNEHEGIQQFVALFSDITVRKSLENQVHQLAFHDPLTQLPNRRLMEDRLSQAMAASKRSGKHGALLVLDLDNFKPLNDQHGHPAGDLLLIEVARRLVGCVRETDTVARFGGDEFVVVLGDLETDYAGSTNQAKEVAEKIRLSLQQPYELNLHCEGPDGRSAVVHHCSASIGVAMFFNHDVSQSELLKSADAAMYQAKDDGRDSVRLFARSD